MLRRLGFVAILGLTSLGVGAGSSACSNKGEDSPGRRPSANPLDDGARNGTSNTAPSAAPATTASGDAPKAILDFLKPETPCTIGHRGFLLDLADATMRARIGGAKLAPPDVEFREHEGASWLAVRSKQLDLAFVAPAEIKAEPLVVEARLRGGVAKSAQFYLNGKPLGGIGLAKGETKIAAVHTAATILRGQNELMVRFTGAGKGTHDELAEIDWIRIGPHDGDAPYSAPTRENAIATVAVGGVSRRGISLRAPGFARCSGFLPNGAVLEGAIGVTGGEAEAEVRLLVDRAEPRVIGTYHLGGPGDPPGYRPLSLPLGDVGTIAGVELVTKTSSKGARVVFAEPRVVASTHPRVAVAPRARGVVLVVFGAMPRKQLGVYGGSIPTPELAQLGGLVFEAHRSSSSVASGALGSMLSGLLPREHGASDPETAFAPTVFAIAEAARQAGIVTAMFTANPTTLPVFGFGRGFETTSAKMPAEDTSATAIFDDVATWLDAHKEGRFFVVVHARGGHPPWDVTSEEMKDLPPANYMGGLEPKHAGEALAKARKTGGRGFADADRERAFALHGKTIAAHDAALGRLVAHVRTMGRDKDTLWIATGDVGVDATARVPFLDDESLDEGALAVPLVIGGPDVPRARITTSTSSVDIARTILEAFSLEPPPQLRGDSLFTIAASPGHERPLLAVTAARFSARWSSFALVGSRDKELRLCNLALDPDCVSDVRATHPLAAEVLHGLVSDELVAKPGGLATSTGAQATTPPPLPPSSRPSTDGPTNAALKAWGR